MSWHTLTVVAAFFSLFAWLLRRRRQSTRNPSRRTWEVVITDFAKPKLPLPVRIFNSLGKSIPVKLLTVDMIILEARKRTGLVDCLDEEQYVFRDGLVKLIQDYNDNKHRLTAFGRICLRNVFVRMVANNLSIADQIKRHPEISLERIASPVFIIGPPRTGSSHLHDTLSQHPVFRTPKHLELLNPVLKEEHLMALEVDPREVGCASYLNLAQYLRPHLSLLHDVGPYVSEEDIFVTGIVFRSIIFGSMFPCREYMQWFGEADHTTAYAFLKLVLQLLQWQDVQMGQSRRRWLLKSPDHSFSLPVLVKVFPDATIIQTHRDMSAVLPSYLNLVVYIHGIFNESVDLKWTGEWWTAWFEFVLHRFVKDQQNVQGNNYQKRLSQTCVLGQILNVLFRDLVSDDLVVVLNLLSSLGIWVDEETREKLDQHVSGHKRHSKGRVVYNGAVFGLKQQSIRDRFSTYHKAFQLESAVDMKTHTVSN